ncbi:helix-turn-helix domain-containing protein [Dyadobacter bucti]|uniref:helix-turn-helix domain-containing protein n=1 Tax=Dyadobacter bucti TaxID=2572203 RepID=UPI003F719F2B
MTGEVSSLHAGASLLQVQQVQTWAEFPENRATSYRILWTVNSRDKNMRQLFVLPPGSAPNPTFGQNCGGYSVSFPEEMLLLTGCRHFYPFASSPGYQPGQPISATSTLAKNSIAIERLIINLSRECRNFHSGDMLVPGLLKVLLVSISRLFQQPEAPAPESDDNRLFQRFMKLVSECGTDRKGIQEYAAALSVKTDVLTETVRKVSGHPASHHIYEQTIRAAKQAAISSHASMKEVAYGLGFRDMAHFSKFFRNKAGMTFSEYKRAYQIM